METIPVVAVGSIQLGSPASYPSLRFEVSSRYLIIQMPILKYHCLVWPSNESAVLYFAASMRR